MDSAKKGADALSAGHLDSAITHYTSAISQLPEAVDYYIQRSSAYRRSKQNEKALSDAEAAVGFAHKRGKRELIAKAQLERGIVLYALGRYADARQVFKWSEEINDKEKRLGIWKIKVEEKLKAEGEAEGNGEVAVEKIPRVDLEEVKDAAAKAKVATSGSASASTTNTGAASRNGTAAGASQPPAPAFTPADKIRHEWYQSTNTVTVSLMAKSVPKDKASIIIRTDSLNISFPLPTGSTFDFTIDPLYKVVDTSASTYKVMSTKIEIVLKKSVPGVKWAKLEGDEPDPDALQTASETTTRELIPPPAGPAYPTSSRSGPKNWDKVVADLRVSDGKDGKANDDDDDDVGGDEVNGFFKKIYKNADPDTRRAMMKSYQESNGTALSTNWSEVSTKTYETSPPDDMEAKRW